jgi:hypothetical protein
MRETQGLDYVSISAVCGLQIGLSGILLEIMIIMKYCC